MLVGEGKVSASYGNIPSLPAVVVCGAVIAVQMNDESGMLNFYTATGSLVAGIQLHKGSNFITIWAFPAGTILYTVINKKKQLVHAGRIVVR